MKRTLLINSSWEPLTFLDSRKVISLLLRDKVEIISVWPGDILIPQMLQELPATVRLKTFIRRNIRMPRFSRKVVMTRDGWMCQYCCVKLTPKDATIDHVVPRSRGGKTEWKNCVAACKPCNRWKADAPLEKSGMRLLSIPRPPSISHFWDLKNGHLVWHPDWHNLIIE